MRHFSQKAEYCLQLINLYSIMHDQTITCRQLFAGHVVGSQPMKGKEKMYQMIIIIGSMLSVFFYLFDQKREVLCCAPTGSGKTAAFILPILHHLKVIINVNNL